MPNLTQREFDLLEELGEYVTEGYFPTPRDLASQLDRGTSVVFEDLERLVDKGEVERAGGGRYRPAT